VPAAGFYRRYGFESVGDVYEVPIIGPHVLMRRGLS
jgi:predicted GNAT family N-acyltransferase